MTRGFKTKRHEEYLEPFSGGESPCAAQQSETSYVFQLFLWLHSRIMATPGAKGSWEKRQRTANTIQPMMHRKAKKHAHIHTGCEQQNCNWKGILSTFKRPQPTELQVIINWAVHWPPPPTLLMQLVNTWDRSMFLCSTQSGWGILLRLNPGQTGHFVWDIFSCISYIVPVIISLVWLPHKVTIYPSRYTTTFKI